MNILIPTHNHEIFAYVTLIVLSAASTNIAGYVHCRYCSNNKVDLIDTNVIIKGLIVLFWLCFAPLPILIFGSWIQMIIGIPASLLLGFMAINLDKKLIRFFLYSKTSLDISPKKESWSISNSEICDLGMVDISQAEKRALKISNNVGRFNNYGGLGNYKLWSVCLVAVFEELIFRGILTSAILEVHSQSLIIPLLILNIGLFGIAHLAFGWDQVIAKSVLGILTTVSLFIFGSIIPPIIIHLFINIYAYRENQEN